jgi:hypothetical protein
MNLGLKPAGGVKGTDMLDETGLIHRAALYRRLPQVWHSPTACQDWYRDALKAGEREGAMDYFIALGEPPHADVTGDNGYAVMPATMPFNVMASKLHVRRALHSRESDARA